MFRRRALLVMAALTVAAAAACGNGNPAADSSPGGGPAAASQVTGGTANVTIDEMSGSAAGFQFQPQKQAAKVGQIVAWVNKSAAPHNVTFDDGSIPSASQNPNDTTQLKFTAAGTFKYQCTIHPGMTAELDVS